jgi:hypothetical protein
MCASCLLVLLELDDLLLYRGEVLLPDVYIPGVDSGLPSLCLWVPWYLQSWKAQRFDCLCDVGLTFLLPLDVVGYGIDHFLVFGRVFCVSDVEGMAFESLHLRNEFLFDWRSRSPQGSVKFLGPLNLGFGLRHILSFFPVCTTGGAVPSKEACTADNTGKFTAFKK